MIPVSSWYDKVWYPGVIVEDISFRPVARWEGDRVSVIVQSFLEIGYFVHEGKGGQSALLLVLSNHGGEALGNVEDGDRAVLVELHHSFGRGGEDGLHWSHGGPYGGQRANGHFDHSIDGDVGHPLGSVGVVVRAGVVFAEPSVDECVVRGLVVDPQEKELLQLKVRLEFKGDDFEGDSVGGEGLWFGCDCSGWRTHPASTIARRVFIDERCHC
jgi:hypothetical protein